MRSRTRATSLVLVSAALGLAACNSSDSPSSASGATTVPATGEQLRPDHRGDHASGRARRVLRAGRRPGDRLAHVRGIHDGRLAA